MTRVLKTFLLWLLIAALPLQGAAAVIKAACGPRHHDISSAAMNVADHHHEEGATPHSHDTGTARSLPTDVALADQTTSDAVEAKKIHKSSYCSACASCCFGAVAPPSFVSLTQAFHNSEAVVVPPAESYIGFIPSSLERPPRHVFA
jgi:hypothetical protein